MYNHLNQAIILFYGYLAIIAICFGWLLSLSQSFYELKKHRLGFVFTLFMFALSMLIILAAAKPIMTAAGLLIILVGAYPYYNEQKWQHFTCALLGMLLGMISLCLEFGQWEIAIICACSALLLKALKVNYLFYWVEFLAMNTIFIGLKLAGI
jgi:hypothetical protein